MFTKLKYLTLHCITYTGEIFSSLILHNYCASMLIFFLIVLMVHPLKEHVDNVSNNFLDAFFLLWPRFSSISLLSLISAFHNKHTGQASSWISTSVLTEGAVIFFVYNLLTFSDLRKFFLAQLP